MQTLNGAQICGVEGRHGCIIDLGCLRCFPKLCVQLQQHLLMQLHEKLVSWHAIMKLRVYTFGDRRKGLHVWERQW